MEDLLERGLFMAINKPYDPDLEERMKRP